MTTNNTTTQSGLHAATRARITRPNARPDEALRVRRRALKSADSTEDRHPGLAAEWRRLAAFALRVAADKRRAAKADAWTLLIDLDTITDTRS